MGFTVFRTILTLLICCFLILMFLLPSAFLSQFSEQAEARMDAAGQALLSGDPEAAAQDLTVLFRLVRDRMPALERFLNHADIDALDASIAVAGRAVQFGDFGAAAEALAEARSILVRIRGIELFSWNSLL